MALLETLDFTGPLGNLSAYKMRGTDKTVLRKKGGATKEQIKTSPQFAVPRLYMSEFAGCATMGKEVRRMLVPLRGLADYNISGPINKLLKVVQKQDTTSKLGRRSILLSKYPRILEGFSFNRKNPFDSLVRNTLTFSLDRETHSAKVDIAALMRDINLFPNNNHPMFSITIALGVVPDFIFNEATGLYEAPKWYDASFGAKEVSTPWYIVKEGSPATTLEVALDKIPQGESYSLVLAIGIRFGTLYGGGVIEQVRYAGAAKVLALRSGETPMASAPGDDEGAMEEEVPDRQWEEMKEGLPEGIVVRGNADTTGGVQAVYTFEYNEGNRKEGVEEVYSYAMVVSEPQAKWEVGVSNVREEGVMVLDESLKTLNMGRHECHHARAGAQHTRQSQGGIVEELKIEELNRAQDNYGYTQPFRIWVIQSSYHTGASLRNVRRHARDLCLDMSAVFRLPWTTEHYTLHRIHHHPL